MKTEKRRFLKWWKRAINPIAMANAKECKSRSRPMSSLFECFDNQSTEIKLHLEKLKKNKVQVVLEDIR